MLEQPAFGERVRALRLERGLSQAALAADGMSTGYLSRLESGARPPTGRIVDHLARRLGVPASAFETASMPQLAQVLAAVTSAARTDDLTEMLDTAVRTDDRRDPALRWQALWLLAGMRGGQGRHEDEHALLTELATVSRDLGSAQLHARARIRLSHCARVLGDNDKARHHADEAYRLARELSIADHAAALHALISSEAELGRLNDARAHADELCELTEDTAGTLFVKALWASATVCIRQGDQPSAQRSLERALQELDSREDLLLWARLRLAAASLYLQSSPPLTERAQARLDEVESVLELVGNELHKQQVLTLRAQVAFEQGRTEDARMLCARIDERSLVLSFRDRIRFGVLHGQLLILDGDVDAGTRELRELALRAQDALYVDLAGEIWRRLATMLSDARQQLPS